MPLRPTPPNSLGPDERDALRTLAPLRKTLEQLVTRRHEALTGKEAVPKAVEAEVELHWTLVLEAFRRGIRAVHQGLHRAEGIDHQMADQALEYAMRDILEEKRNKGR